MTKQGPAEKAKKKTLTTKELTQVVDNLAAMVANLRRQLEVIDATVTIMCIEDKRDVAKIEKFTPETLLESAKTSVIPYGVKAQELVAKTNEHIQAKQAEKEAK